jgi:hypothetical protein
MQSDDGSVDVTRPKRVAHADARSLASVARFVAGHISASLAHAVANAE